MPKPRIALQIGITGHRLNKLDTGSATALDQALRALYAMMDAAIGKIFLDTKDRVYSSAPPLKRMVSGLAEGADRFAVLALPGDWRLEAVLPMPRDEYARDFLKDETHSDSVREFELLLSQASSVTELPLLPGLDIRTDEVRARHYGALGAFLVRQIDLLVAVWDGEKAEGPGGTAAVIAQAVNEGRPVIWIEPKNPAAPRVRLALEGEDAPAAPLWEPLDSGVLDLLLRAILMPPALGKPEAHDETREHEVMSDVHDAATPVSEPSFFGLSWPKPMRWPFAYNLLRRLCGVGRWSWPIAYPSFDMLATGWNDFFAAIARGNGKQVVEFNDRMRAILLPRSIWADALAWRLGHLYRSAYVSVFLLAGISVPLGLCYLFFLESPAVLDIKAGFVALELLIITTVIVVVRLGVRAHWHAGWLEARALSELLRQGRSLAYVGALRDFVAPPRPGASEDYPSWYARATFREIGMPSGVLDARRLGLALTATLNTEIVEQRSYHAANARNLAKIHHTLHHKGEACFAATIVALLFYLATWGLDQFSQELHAHAQEVGHAVAIAHTPFHRFLEYVVKPIVSIAAAGLPAMGAALSGICAQGDFEGFARRSATTERELAEIAQRIRSMLAAPEQIDLNAATNVLLAATNVMAKDVGAWRQLYSSKRLALPA